MADFEVVERAEAVEAMPSRRIGKHDALITAVVDSAATGKAVKVALNGGGAKLVNVLRNVVYLRLLRYHTGLSAHSRTNADGSEMFIWAERKVGVATNGDASKVGSPK